MIDQNYIEVLTDQNYIEVMIDQSYIEITLKMDQIYIATHYTPLWHWPRSSWAFYWWCSGWNSAGTEREIVNLPKVLNPSIDKRIFWCLGVFCAEPCANAWEMQCAGASWARLQASSDEPTSFLWSASSSKGWDPPDPEEGDHWAWIGSVGGNAQCWKIRNTRISHDGSEIHGKVMTDQKYTAKLW